MKKIENGCQDKLDWFDGKHINEILFCQEFCNTIVQNAKNVVKQDKKNKIGENDYGKRHVRRKPP